MSKHPISMFLTISMIVIMGGIGLSACASLAAAQPQSDVQSYVNTAVAATLVQQIIETKVAAESSSFVSEPIAQVQTTEPPAPTPSPTSSPTVVIQPTAQAPTAIPPPTATIPPAPASNPKIYSDQNTNCRVGPGTGYSVITYFMKGDTSTVHGRDSTKDWWFIANPDESATYCWVWDDSTTVEGDTSQVPVVAAPVEPAYKASYAYGSPSYYDPYHIYDYNDYDDIPSNWCGQTCKVTKNWCNQKVQVCKPVNCAPCNCTVKCGCAPVNWQNQWPVNWQNPWPVNWQNGCGTNWKNPCKKSSCPPVTQVNFQNYCKKYPNCCK